MGERTMRTHLHSVIPLLAAAAIIGCTSHSGRENEPTGRTTSALSHALGLVVPAVNGVSKFPGTDGELVMADAISECSWATVHTFPNPPVDVSDTLIIDQDETMSRVATLMQGTLASSGSCAGGSGAD